MADFEAVILGEIGSFAHGLNTEESDHDYMGIHIDPPECLIGLQPERGVIRDRDKPEGVKSMPGDSEATYCGLRKYVSLVVQGNPTMMTLLFTPNLPIPDHIGIRKVRDMFLSRRLAARHIGYADSMAARITGERAPRTNRPELIEKHGFDTKASFHAIRLLMQGHEMLTRQTMQMPMTELKRQYLLDVRHGKVSQADVLENINYWREELRTAESQSPLPEHPDYGRINEWLVTTHHDAWRSLV